MVERSDGYGKAHDFQIFKNSKLRFSEQVFLYADSSYQGLKDHHKNSFLPTKKPKNGEFSIEEKQENQRISKIRILVENVLALIKNFRVISDVCRYRLNKIAKRFNVICLFWYKIG